MKTNTKDNIRNKWALEGEPITLEDFKKGIEKAEMGSFYSIEESKKIVAQWRRSKNSK